MQRQPYIGRKIGDPVSEKPGRRNTDDGEGLGLDEDGGSYDGGVGGKLVLPCAIADFSSGRGRGRIVAIEQDAPHIGSQAERCKVIAGDKFADEKFCSRIAAAHVQICAPRLDRGQLLELRR
jgi:hypothetical protein